jgi:hypothetical protein
MVDIGLWSMEFYYSANSVDLFKAIFELTCQSVTNVAVWMLNKLQLQLQLADWIHMSGGV